jgi:glycosyltransferase involved in cell wall biosynthesis
MGQLAKPIRVLYLIDTLWGRGGAELALLRLVEELYGNGFVCTVVTFHTSDTLRHFRDSYSCPVLWWETKNIFSLQAWRVALKLRRFVREESVDIVHTFFPSADLWAGPLAKLFGAKVLISSRRDMGILRQPKHDRAYRLLSRYYDQVQTVSEAVRAFTITHDRMDPRRVVTIYNGIESDAPVASGEVDHLKQRFRIKSDVPVIVCVANFRPVKGVDVLVKALALVNEQNWNWQMLAVGGLDGTTLVQAYSEEVMELSRRLRVDEQIRFIGYQENVSALLSLGDIFAMPSRSEGLSNALLEAMRAGLPCVATAVGGNPEVVVDQKTGFLVPTENPRVMADALLKLLAEPELRQKMGRCARARMLESFTVGAMVSKVREQYGAVLASRR